MKVLLQFRLGNIAVSSSFFFFGGGGGGPVLASLYESSHCCGSELGGPHFLQPPIYHILCTKYHLVETIRLLTEVHWGLKAYIDLGY